MLCRSGLSHNGDLDKDRCPTSYVGFKDELSTLVKKLFFLLQNNLRPIVEMANKYIAKDFCTS